MTKAVLYDFDGVILDSMPTMYEWFKKVCGIFGKQFHYKSPTELRGVYFEALPDLYLHFGFDWEKESDAIWAEYNKHKVNMQPGLVRGIEGVIKELWAQLVPLGIASNAVEPEIRDHLKRLKIDEYFNVVIGRENKKRKPDPEILLAAAKELRIEPKDCFYIGDTAMDIQAARNAGMKSVAAFFGDSSYSILENLINENPDFIITEPGELIRVVLRN